MDFFSILMNDPVVFAFTFMIVFTALFAGYMKYYFIKNIKNQEKAEKHQQQIMKTEFSDERL